MTCPFRNRLLLFSVLSSLFPLLPATAADPGFEQAVAGIIRKRCSQCHRGTEPEGGLSLDQARVWRTGGDSMLPTVVPGKSAKSELMRRIEATDESERMPPEGDRLSAAEIQTIREWIEAGARLPEDGELARLLSPRSDHWSLQPIQRPEVPRLPVSWGRNPIDAFIQQRLQAEGLGPSAAAHPRDLVRRISLDMLGLPPLSSEVRGFSDRTDEWSRFVDRILASPHYGERWARHWLDVVRFGETHGFETNRERPNAWRFRDYVIRAFNDDLPYDRFIREQIAGDHWNAPVATGFLVAGSYDLVKSPDVNLTLMQRQDELADMINTTGTTFLGLTLGCARCHNHKFDPVTQQDYYSIQAIFAGVKHGDRPLPPQPDQQQFRKRLEKQIEELDRRLDRFIVERDTGFVIVDDANIAKSGGRGFEARYERAGEGVNPAGTDRGHRDDPGDSRRNLNLSSGKYTWWKNRPGEFITVCHPRERGRFVVWLSWGCGYETHCRDVDYVLDRDGDLTTTADQSVLATIDQQRFADGSRVPGPAALWSGLKSVGPVRLEPQSIIALRGGQDGDAVTSDVIVLQAVPEKEGRQTTARLPRIRPPVNSERNVDPTSGQLARWIRFTILRTNSSQPCLDELEVWSGGRNIALASLGTKARSSSNLPGYAIHQLKHIHDGRYGNAHSWISNEDSAGWIELELPEAAAVDQVVWGRDRERRFTDRTALEYRIEFAVTPEQWTLVSDSSQRLPADAFHSGQPTHRFDSFDPPVAAEGRQWLAERDSLKARLKQQQAGAVAYAGMFEQPGPTHRLYRGDPQAPREEVRPDTIELLGTLDLELTAPEQSRRIAFADWLGQPTNPLVARVIVNRIWAYHFGTGIVATPNDLGVNGARPTHPALLDWLAAELIESGWSLKHLHRLILTSATYRQSATPREDGLRTDAASRLLWRFPPRRLEAEAIRDSVLSVTGVLDRRMRGPGFSAFRVEPENVRHYFPKESYGPSDWRRMIYMTKVRQEQDSVFGVFDCPDANQSVPRRSRSTTPLQALNLFNSRFMLQQAQLLSQSVQDSGTSSDRIVRIFERVLCRNPEPAELASANAFVTEHGLEALCRAMLNCNEFLFLP